MSLIDFFAFYSSESLNTIYVEYEDLKRKNSKYEWDDVAKLERELNKAPVGTVVSWNEKEATIEKLGTPYRALVLRSTNDKDKGAIIDACSITHVKDSDYKKRYEVYLDDYKINDSKVKCFKTYDEAEDYIYSEELFQKIMEDYGDNFEKALEHSFFHICRSIHGYSHFDDMNAGYMFKDVMKAYKKNHNKNI